MTALRGKTITIQYDGNPAGLSKIYQDAQMAGQDSLYSETNRPQYHFSSRRGWINDPNGLIFYEGLRRQNLYAGIGETPVHHWQYLCGPDLRQYAPKRSPAHSDRLGADSATGQIGQWTALPATEANEKLKALPSSDRFRIRTTLSLPHATSAGLSLFGQRILDYDLNANLVNGVFYSPEEMTRMTITVDIYLDRTSIEVFIDGGAYSYSLERKPVSTNTERLRFWGNRIEVGSLDLYTAKSIWK